MDLVTWDFIVECDLECLHATGYLSKMFQHHHHGVSYRYSAESISRIDRAVHMHFSTFFFWKHRRLYIYTYHLTPTQCTSSSAPAQHSASSCSPTTCG